MTPTLFAPSTQFTGSTVTAFSGVVVNQVTTSWTTTTTTWDYWTEAANTSYAANTITIYNRWLQDQRGPATGARSVAFRAAHDQRQAEVSAANRRAEDLLRSCLSEEQQRDLDTKGCFYLESFGKDGRRRRYRIDRGTHGNVKLLDADGRIVGSYCVQPNGVPAADAMLAQKLWLETNEEAFLKVANFTAFGR